MFNENIKEANQTSNVYVIKRDGTQAEYEPNKIKIAIGKANNEVRGIEKLTSKEINEITENITKTVMNANRAYSVEEIQDLVIKEIIYLQHAELAEKYIVYRYKHNEKRNMSDIDRKIKNIVDVTVEKDGHVAIKNEEVKQENSNKNPTILSVQRDYMAGEWSRHFVDKYILPEEIKEAHKEGIIHFHDSDYFANRMHNCDLINLEDMLQNGTVISGTKIDKPHSFLTACTVTSQIVAQVASSQYGLKSAV